MRGRRKSEERHVAESAAELEHGVADAVIAEVAAAGVLVDHQGDVLRFYGRTGDYLELAQGEPTRSLLRMARPEIEEPLRVAFASAKRHRPAARHQARVSFDREGMPPLLLEILPVQRDEQAPNHFVVLFEPRARQRPIRPHRMETTLPARPAHLDLASELHQQSVVREELRTANEELSTVNAELRSVNEEIERSRDQLRQRAFELRLRNRDLARTNLALKRSVQEAKAARDRATIIFEAMPLPVLALDAGLRVVSANRACCEFMQRTHEAIVGSDFLALTVDPSLGAQLRAILLETLAERRPAEDLEIEADLPDKGRRTLAVGARTILSDRGEPLLLLTLEDTTERRRRQEERLREQAGRAQRLLNEAGRLLLSEPLDSNAMLPKLAQLVVPELADVCAVDLIDGTEFRRAALSVGEQASEVAPGPAELDPGEQAAVRELAAGGDPIFVTDLERGTAAASLGWMRDLGMQSCLGLPLRTPSGVLGALWLGWSRGRRNAGPAEFATAEGLSQRAGMAVERARLYSDATAAVVMREEFMSIASHELRTPLTAMQLQLEVLRNLLDRADFGEKARATDRTRRLMLQAQRMGRLIENMLSVSRIMAGKLVLDLEPADLVDIATEVVERMTAEAERAGSRIELHAQGPVPGRFDPLRIDQVMTNLLTNAIRYAPNTTITVSVEADEQRARLRVRDRGPGVPAARSEHIFERFETAAHQATVGLGLGLYISRQLVEAHHGTIQLEAPSEEAGASFLVDLPRDPTS